jgi:aspartate dehydrogenase
MKLPSHGPTKFGIIGKGAIAHTITQTLASYEQQPDFELPEFIGSIGRQESLNLLLTEKPNVVIEAAGHQALAQHGVAVLEAGIDLMVASVGALADALLLNQLSTAARSGGSSLLIAAGALGGLDALASAKWAGFSEVTYRSEKSPKAWQGTAAQQLVDLENVTASTVFFEGNAREAALMFPQNANVAAAVALAGAGFEKTTVQLCADPHARFNRHLVNAQGPFGSIAVQIEGRVLPQNPKTSMLAPLSLVEALVNRCRSIRLV